MKTILILFLIITLLSIFIFLYQNYLMKKDDDDGLVGDEFDEIENESPINYILSDYKINYMDNHYIGSKFKTIFIIDNNPIYQRIYFDILNEKFNILFFLDGEDFLKYCYQYHPNVYEVPLPDLIIASDTIPIINGVQLFNIIHKNNIKNLFAIDKLKQTPYFITSIDKEFFNENFNLIVKKPIDEDFLIKNIKKYI